VIQGTIWKQPLRICSGIDAASGREFKKGLAARGGRRTKQRGGRRSGKGTRAGWVGTWGRDSRATRTGRMDCRLLEPPTFRLQHLLRLLVRPGATGGDVRPPAPNRSHDAQLLGDFIQRGVLGESLQGIQHRLLVGRARKLPIPGAENKRRADCRLRGLTPFLFPNRSSSANLSLTRFRGQGGAVASFCSCRFRSDFNPNIFCGSTQHSKSCRAKCILETRILRSPSCLHALLSRA
jgi:hypothetical protein